MSTSMKSSLSSIVTGIRIGTKTAENFSGEGGSTEEDAATEVSVVVAVEVVSVAVGAVAVEAGVEGDDIDEDNIVDDEDDTCCEVEVGGGIGLELYCKTSFS